MKTYNVIVEPEAKKQMRRHLSYIKNKLKNPQAADSVYRDFLASVGKLSTIAGSIKEPEDEALIKRGLMLFTPILIAKLTVNFQIHGKMTK